MSFPDNHNHFLMAGDIGAMVAAAEQAGIAGFGLQRAQLPHRRGARGDSVPRQPLDARGPAGRAAGLRGRRSRGRRALRRIRVLLGLEMDVRPEDPAFEAASDAITALRDDWDVVLGSVHTMSDDCSVQDEQVGARARGRLAGLPRAPAHRCRLRRFDIIRTRSASASRCPASPTASPTCSLSSPSIAAEHGVALEVNGSALRRRPDLVQVLVDELAKHDAPISLGSDAHLPGGGRVHARRRANAAGARAWKQIARVAQSEARARAAAGRLGEPGGPSGRRPPIT